MVLDAKAMTWAAQNGIDTAKLKAAKVPIYGKWYFPELPPRVALVNLETGERAIFPDRMVAGEVVWVAESDLRRAGLGPYADPATAPPPLEVPDEDRTIQATAMPAVHEGQVEPFIAMSRVPGEGTSPHPESLPRSVLVPVAGERDLGPGIPAGVHLPLPSIAPFVLGVGFAITLVGLVLHPVVVLVGGVWSVIGALGWVRIGLIEARSSHASHDAR